MVAILIYQSKKYATGKKGPECACKTNNKEMKNELNWKIAWLNQKYIHSNTYTREHAHLHIHKHTHTLIHTAKVGSPPTSFPALLCCDVVTDATATAVVTVVFVKKPT